MILPAPLLAPLPRLAAQKHDGLKGFVLANGALRQTAAVRRTARHGLAVLAARLHPSFLEVLDLFEDSLRLARQRAPP